ncbi:MAG: hypothetical protein JXB03_04790 [Spirochaetales bacterium]|nr:hypothetical protein [Spirochaetales bacterium]
MFEEMKIKNKLIKIMPVGDSITAGEHYGEPALEKRTGYRKLLYEKLIKAGYNVEFTGSQIHGRLPENDANWFGYSCEAYPGWDIPAITKRVKSSLAYYRPDILLIHAGTNGSDWNRKPEQMKKMLDMINDFSVKENHPITVFVCLIINQFRGKHTPTSRFNNKIADMLNTRTGDTIRLIPVNMENEAGIDYSDNTPNPESVPPYEGGDMWGEKYPGIQYDAFHPNEKGNAKIALKFYKELIAVL